MFRRRTVLMLLVLLFAGLSTHALCDEYPELTIPLPEGSEQTIMWVGTNPSGENVYQEGWPTIAQLSAFRQGQLRTLTFHVPHYHLAIENDAIYSLQGNPFGFCTDRNGCVAALQSECNVVFWEKGGYGPSGCEGPSIKTFQAYEGPTGIFCSCDCIGAGYVVLRCSTYVPPPPEF